jgi:hypothetical protein
MLSVLCLAQPRFSAHIISLPASAETPFNLFDRPSSPAGLQAPRQKRRVHLPDLVQDVGQFENDELVDLIRVAIGEARRRGIGSVSATSDSSQGMAPVEKRTTPVAARIIRKAAPMPDIPPAKASMVRAAVRAGFSPTRVEGFRSVSCDGAQAGGDVNEALWWVSAARLVKCPQSPDLSGAEDRWAKTI